MSLQNIIQETNDYSIKEIEKTVDGEKLNSSKGIIDQLSIQQWKIQKEIKNNEQKKLQNKFLIDVNNAEFRRNLKRIRWRWIALVLISLFVCGSYFSYDTPSSVQQRIEQLFGVSSTIYSLLYSFYSLPNIVVPLIAGMMLRKIGNGKGLVVCSILVVIGQFIGAVGGYKRLFWLICIGRAIFGIGSETLYVLKQVYTSLWFYDQEISLAMGFNNLIPFFFSFLGGITIPLVASKDNSQDLGIGIAFGLGAYLCAITFIFAILFLLLDNKQRAHDEQFKKNLENSIKDQEKNNLEISQINKMKNILSESFEQQDFQTQRQNVNYLTEMPQLIQNEDNESIFSMKDIERFDLGFWLMATDNLLSYSIMFTLTCIGQKMIIQRFGVSQQVAGNINVGMPNLIACFLFPIVGYISDKYGRRQSILIISNVIQIFSFLLLLLMPNRAELNIRILIFVHQGISTAVFQVLQWGSVSYMVHMEGLQTAQGLLASITNFGQTIFPIIISSIYDETHLKYNYVFVDLFFIFISFLSLCVKLILYYWDKQIRGGVLESNDIDGQFKIYEMQKKRQKANIDY